MIPIQYALRRRMMVCSGSFSFEYTGNYTDNRGTNGIGTVRFTSSGTLTVLNGTATVSAYILGAGGGAACWTRSWSKASAGGSGGIQTVEVELAPGTYDIVIGTGGNAINRTSGSGTYSASQGGTTTAFGCTSTGGKGGTISNLVANCSGGLGGSPNGNTGNYDAYGSSAADGGAPNGGSVINSVANDGGDGYVEITFS